MTVAACGEKGPARRVRRIARRDRDRGMTAGTVGLCIPTLRWGGDGGGPEGPCPGHPRPLGR